MSAVFVYITTSNFDEAKTIGHALVESRLAACANILGGITSLFWWEGSVQEDGEVALIVKTRRDLVIHVTEKVKALHSYDCPCVVALPVDGGNSEFLNWIGTETGGAAEA